MPQFSRRDLLFSGVAMPTLSHAAEVPQTASPAESPASPSTLLSPDFRKLVSRADLHYTEPAPRGEAGQPIGNGRMGTLV